MAVAKTSEYAVPDYIKENPAYSKINFMAKRIGSSFCGIATGRWRSGKSVSAGVRTCYDLDRDYDGKPRFTIDKVVFDPKNFIKQMAKKQPRCSTVLWDETGATLGKRDWYSAKNKLVSQLFQTMGYKSRILMLTAPSISYVDSHSGPILDFWVRMKEYQTFQKNLAYGKFYWTRWNEEKGRIFKHWHRETKDGILTVYDRPFVFHSPPQELVEKYLDKERDAKNLIFDKAGDLIDFMNKQMHQSTKNQITEPELFEELSKDLGKYTNSEGTKIESSLVMLENKGLDYRVVARVVKALNIKIMKGEISL